MMDDEMTHGGDDAAAGDDAMPAAEPAATPEMPTESGDDAGMGGDDGAAPTQP